MERSNRFATAAVALLLLAACQRPPDEEAAEVPDPAEVQAGERLFLETRFAQFFFANAGGDPNAVLVAGDPAMDDTRGVLEDFVGPFKGKSMNCRACHLVDEHAAAPGGGIRTYADFARRSPIPDRGDGKTVTPRNSPPLVNSSLPRATGLFFHFDGEFPTLDDLVRATFTGRNFGWLATEEAQAVANLAAVVRGDDGSGDLAQSFGGMPYAVLLQGTSPYIPVELRLPPAFRIDVATATDLQIFNAVAALVAAYVDSLRFARNLATGEFAGSPFDLFLARNGLPTQPDPLESDLDYGRRLRNLVNLLAGPVFVTPADGAFALHSQEFRFGPKELDGLKIFLAEPSVVPPMAGELAAGRIGSCISCHAPPAFTDFRFHNVGVAQSEFDGIHGSGAFAALSIPSLTVRNGTPDLYLPASPARPAGQGPFLDVPSAGNNRTDLGLWNVFANSAVPGSQASLQALLGVVGAPGDADLAATIALFKTPPLRDLGQSAPYFHTGQKKSFDDVIQHYVDFSTLARSAAVRNGAPELAGIVILPADVEALRAFLRSLNEDYQ